MASLPEFLDRVSISNLIRRATQPEQVLALPPEYAQTNPDLLGMEADKLLTTMRNLGTEGNYFKFGNGEQVVPPYAPKQQLPADFRPGVSRLPQPVPLVGRDIPVETLTDWIRQKESSGDYSAINREAVGNTASGAYQYTDATWNGYGGYAKAFLAPPEVQDRRFAEDIARRIERFGGDPFKVIAAHYLPAIADKPQAWTKPYKLPSGKTVPPAASYIAYVVRGTPLEDAFDAYIRNEQQSTN